MEENPFVNKNIKTLKEIPAILKSRNILITKKEEIKELVEEPLVKACEMFWDKNIKTYESSANTKNIKVGICYIKLDYESLSEENKNITSVYGEPHE